MSEPTVTPWPGSSLPDRATLWQIMSDEGLSAYTWSNGPHDIYAEHAHSYDKVIYVLSGSITFGLPDLGQKLTLNAGDRLDLPAGIAHNAIVGPQGVVCLEGHKGSSIF